MKDIINIRKSPYGLLLLTVVPVLFALSIIPIADIDLRDKTVFSLPLATMLWVIPSFLIFFWFLYLLTKRFLYSRAITWIHVLVTVIATILITAILYISIIPSRSINERYELIGNAIQILSIIFIVGQLVYLVNVLLGILVRHKIQ